MKKVAVLFAMPGSIYHNYPECDVYDEARDARTYPGGIPIVAHPPCRLWGKLSHLSTAPIEEKQLAIFAVRKIREHGGVLEHPRASKLWAHMGLPYGQNIDEYGGFTLSVDQFWWGHKAMKRTLLYVVGCKPSEIPLIPLRWELCMHTISNKKASKGKNEISKKTRLATPPKFAEWLIELAKKCKQ